MSSEESASEEWEDVEPLKAEDSLAVDLSDEQLVALSQSQGVASSSGAIEIALDKDTKRRKSKEKSEFEKAFEAFQKELLHNMHKTHLLCLVCHGIQQSKLCDHHLLQALLLSMIVNEGELYRKDSTVYNQALLLKLLKWFVAQIEKMQVTALECELEVSGVHLLVALLRVLRLRARLVTVLKPVPFKPVSTNKKFSVKKGSPSKVTNKMPKKTNTKNSKKSQLSSKSSTTQSDTSPYFKKKMRRFDPRENGKRTLSKTRDSSSEQSENPSSSKDDDDEFEPPKLKKRKVDPKKGTRKVTELKPPPKVEASTSAASDLCTTDTGGGGVNDYSCWVEVLLAGEQKWVCLHIPSESIGQPQLCERDCPLTMDYVLAFESNTDVSRVTVRDVTPRYASDWCTRVYKQRLDRSWWEETLQPFELSDPTEREKENEDIIATLYAQPLPSSMSEYKSHPLYVAASPAITLYALGRHLLKFEAIYPEGSQVLGYCRGEPVYSRNNVHTLHTRETWLKEGRLVRLGETAYKSVKARPKKGKSVIENAQSTVDVFGRWQTEEYIAQPIVDGKVPRNEYGNVELFQPSMLPPGGVHIKIQGIQRVARKLGIDYAPAMMGWDFHGGYCHPIIQGIVVAEENEQLIVEAWEQEEQIKISKAIKKREKRVLDSWRRLTRALLIKERLKQKYNYD